MSALAAARFLLGLGISIDRRRLLRSSVLMLAGYLAIPFLAWSISRFIDDAIAGRHGTLANLAAAIAVLIVMRTMCTHFAHLDYFELAEMQESALRAELIDLVNRSPRMSHLDNPQFADDLSLVRESLVTTTRALEATLQLAGLLAQTVVTSALLVAVSPWLVLLPLTAIPPVFFARRAQNLYEGARERTAGSLRLSRHLLELSTSASSVREIRVFGGAADLMGRQAAAWAEVTSVLSRSHAKSAMVRSAGQMIFSLGYGAAILLILWQAAHGEATVGDVVLVISLAVQVSIQISTALQLLSQMQSTAKTVERIERLRALAEPGKTAQPPERPTRASPPSPARLRTGITLDRVSFRYPGADRDVLTDVSLTIPAGSSLALVGENGAGKSTLIKLLCGLYAPVSGEILVDGIGMDALPAEQWRARVAPLFQDFYRFQFTLGEGVGLGNVDALDDAPAIRRAIDRASARNVVDAVPGGLGGFVGSAYGDGPELSGGQWQAIGLARCMMRPDPLLVLLDEPAAALDAAAEDALFARYTDRSAEAAAASGAITVLVSHRLSTVRLADTIAVLENGRLTQHGSHEELMRSGGLYADLYTMQAQTYQ